jgi:hypothetical protein
MFSFTLLTRIKSSKHIVHGTQVSEVSSDSDSDSCQIDRLLLHINACKYHYLTKHLPVFLQMLV